MYIYKLPNVDYKNFEDICAELRLSASFVSLTPMYQRGMNDCISQNVTRCDKWVFANLAPSPKDPGKYTKIPDPKALKFRDFYPSHFGQILSKIRTTPPPNPIFTQISD